MKLMIKKLDRLFRDKNYRKTLLDKKGIVKLSDREYLEREFYLRMGYSLNLDNPKSFNEKLQWLKLYNRKEVYTSMVDKFEAKKYVGERIGEDHIIPTLGVWEKFSDINFENLPNQFVLKCTHDSGGLIICKEKKNLDLEKARSIIDKSLSRDYWGLGREWPYKNVHKRIIAEQYMVDESGEELKDYKIFCFNGVPKVIQLDYGRFTDHHRNMYSADWEVLPMQYVYTSDKRKTFEKPQKFDEMLSYAKKLSAGIPFVRCDFYSINENIYFGELTFFPESGFGKFASEEWDIKLGTWLEIPSITE